jgi:hypothetical protein
MLPDTQDARRDLWRKLAQSASGTAPAATASVRDLMAITLRALLP